MDYVKLNNGVKMPMLGFGAFQIPKAETAQCVLNAIEVGYRSIDTAQSYFNEEEVGDAIAKTSVPRKGFVYHDKSLDQQLWSRESQGIGFRLDEETKGRLSRFGFASPTI